MSEDKQAAFTTLYRALLELTQAMAPCAPFLAEHIYRELRSFDNSELPESVHLCQYPVAKDELMSEELEAAVTRMQQVILLGRRQRENHKVSLRVPLQQLRIIHNDEALLGVLRGLESYIKTELNVKQVVYEPDESKYIRQFAKPNFPLLGKRLGKRMREFQSEFSALTQEDLDSLSEKGSIQIKDEEFSVAEIQVFREAINDTDVVTDRLIAIQLDMNIDESLKLEGLARELVHRIQLARKARSFEVTDRIQLTVDGSPRVLDAFQQHQDYIVNETLTTRVETLPTNAFVEDLDGEEFRFDLERRVAA